VALLNSGADDYMVKPFNTGELVARINVALRQGPEQAEAVFASGDLKVDVVNRLVSLGATGLGSPRPSMLFCVCSSATRRC
jgi:two-component system KDP operon response regulator KdpE